MTPDLAFNTAVSFVTNTNWQAYSGESTMSYFVQMAALTVQNFASAAAGIAVAIALVRGFARQETEDHRQLLGGSDAQRRSTSCCRCRFVAALFLCSQGVIQNFDPYTRSRRSRARRRPLRRGRSRRRKRSSSSAPTAAASSTPTRRIRSRIRRRCANFCSDVADLRDSRGPDLHVRPDGRRHAAGLGDVRGDVA